MAFCATFITIFAVTIPGLIAIPIGFSIFQWCCWMAHLGKIIRVNWCPGIARNYIRRNTPAIEKVLQKFKKEVCRPKDVKLTWSKQFAWIRLKNIQGNHIFHEGEILQNSELGPCRISFKEGKLGKFWHRMYIVPEKSPTTKIGVHK
jgi:hypothetical protein